MKTAKFLVIFVAATMLITVSARAMVESEVSNTRTASCLVRVTCAQEVLPLAPETIRYLLRSSTVGGKAAKDVLGILFHDKLLDIEELSSEPGVYSRIAEYIDTTQMQPHLDYMMMEEAKLPKSRSTRRGTTSVPQPEFIDEPIFFFRLQVDLREEVIGQSVKPAAEEFMSAVIKNMREALNIAADDFVNRLRGYIQLAGDEVARTENQLVALQTKLRELSDSGQLSGETILANISRLRQELRSVKMTQASQSATVETISKKIAEAEANAKKKLQEDLITSELQRLLTLQMQQFEYVKKRVEDGRNLQSDLADAEERLARARIELAKRREELSKSAGGDLIASLNNQLSNISVELAQYEARISSIEQQLDEARELLAKADEYELLSIKAGIAKQNLQEAILWRDRMSREERLLQLTPTVTVLGSGGI